jgi:hypothetical protein
LSGKQLIIALVKSFFMMLFKRLPKFRQPFKLIRGILPFIEP